MSARTPKSIFTRKPDEKETVNFRLPAGTRERINNVNTRLREHDPMLNFDLAVEVEGAVERALVRAERELEELDARHGDTVDTAAPGDGAVDAAGDAAEAVNESDQGDAVMAGDNRRGKMPLSTAT